MSVLNQKIANDSEMKVKYSSPVYTVGPESSVFETLRIMQEKFVKRIVIVVKNRPVGIVTERDINRFLGNDKTARAVNEIPIKHVMQKNVISIIDGLEDHFDQCAARMITFKIGSVVLLNESGDLIGIVSRTDLAKTYASIFGGKYSVKDFMTKNVVTCRKSDNIRYALSLMNQNNVSRLVVTDNDGNPIGLITTNTLLTHSDYFTKDETRSRDYLVPIKKGDKLMAGDLIESKLLTIHEEEDLATAANIMIKNSISGIPVVDAKKNLVGLVSKTDVVKAFSVVGPHKELRDRYEEEY